MNDLNEILAKIQWYYEFRGESNISDTSALIPDILKTSLNEENLELPAIFGKEPTQNVFSARSPEAVKAGKPARIEYNLTNRFVEKDEAQKWLKGLDQPLIAGPSNPLDVDEIPQEFSPFMGKSFPQEKISYYTVSDYNTTGLIGEITKEANPGNFYYFVHKVGQSNQRAGKMGSRGVGKRVFWDSSEIKTLFIYSQRKNGAVLTGRTFMFLHKKNEITYLPMGFFGSDLGVPLTDETHPEELERFKKTFEIKRDSEDYGTDMVIVNPIKYDKHMIEQMKIAIVYCYQHAIIAEKLESKITTENGEIRFNSNTLEKETEKIDWDNNKQPRMFPIGGKVSAKRKETSSEVSAFLRNHNRIEELETFIPDKEKEVFVVGGDTTDETEKKKENNYIKFEPIKLFYKGKNNDQSYDSFWNKKKASKSKTINNEISNLLEPSKFQKRHFSDEIKGKIEKFYQTARKEDDNMMVFEFPVQWTVYDENDEQEIFDDTLKFCMQKFFEDAQNSGRIFFMRDYMTIPGESKLLKQRSSQVPADVGATFLIIHPENKQQSEDRDLRPSIARFLQLCEDNNHTKWATNENYEKIKKYYGMNQSKSLLHLIRYISAWIAELMNEDLDANLGSSYAIDYLSKLPKDETVDPRGGDQTGKTKIDLPPAPQTYWETKELPSGGLKIKSNNHWDTASDEDKRNTILEIQFETNTVDGRSYLDIAEFENIAKQCSVKRCKQKSSEKPNTIEVHDLGQHQQDTEIKSFEFDIHGFNTKFVPKVTIGKKEV